MGRIVSGLLSAALIMATGCAGRALALDEGGPAVMTADKARALILDMCKAEEGVEVERCDCYVDTIRKTLPPQSYDRIMILAAYVAAGDEDGAKRYLESSGTLERDFLPLMLDLQSAVTKSSEVCGL